MAAIKAFAAGGSDGQWHLFDQSGDVVCGRDIRRAKSSGRHDDPFEAPFDEPWCFGCAGEIDGLDKKIANTECDRVRMRSWISPPPKNTVSNGSKRSGGGSKTGTKTARCPDCGKAFKNGQGVKMHQRSTECEDAEPVPVTPPRRYTDSVGYVLEEHCALMVKWFVIEERPIHEIVDKFEDRYDQSISKAVVNKHVFGECGH